MSLTNEGGKYLRILFVGDIVGSPGRRTVKQLLPGLRDNYEIDLVIANCENAAGGMGVTPEVVKELFGYHVDVLTSGNHVWDKKEVLQVIGGESRLLRPANMSPSAPGRGVGFYPVGDCVVAVLNVMGRVFMSPSECPFERADREIKLMQKITPIIVVDFHAEATSEKLAMGFFLKDRVSAVIGTHTHVQTADERIYPGKAAYISDVGMVGPYNSVLGLDPGAVLDRFLSGIPVKWKVAGGECIFNAVYLEINRQDGQALEIKRIFNKLNI